MPDAPPVTEITLRQPDDWHVHLRDGAMLAAVLPYTAAQFGRAIVMPNLTPPIVDAAAALAYRARILAALPAGSAFQPLMVCYLTDRTTPAMIDEGVEKGAFLAVKLYPAHATTNAAHGVTDLLSLTPVLERMADHGMPLLVHGEVTDPDVDIFDREAVFIDRVLIPLRTRVPSLKIVFEHITTAEAAAYVLHAEPGIGATVTPHHLIINRNALFAGGLRPHAYCLPVAKREHHRQALRQAVTGNSDRFFLGTDTAPHAQSAKESACGCAGIFCAPTALQSYIDVFDQCDALHRFEAFASLNGPRFYGLPPNETRITLIRRPMTVPPSVNPEIGCLTPFRAGETIDWALLE